MSVSSAAAPPASQISRVLSASGRWLSGSIPVSIVAALLIGAVFMMLAGVNPLDGYLAMLQGSFGSGMGWASTLQRAIPIIGLGIAIAIAFRAGVLNLGTEGQAVLGALAGGMVAVYVPGPGPLIALLAIITAVVVGALWGLLAGVLQNALGVPILLSTLLLNYPARYFSSWLIRYRLDEPSSDLIASEQLDPSVQLGMMVGRDSGLAAALRDGLGPMHPVTAILTGVNWSLLFVLVLVVGTAFMNRRTKFGFESGLAGLNPEFTRYGGVKPGPLVLRTMALSGGIAGLIDFDAASPLAWAYGKRDLLRVWRREVSGAFMMVGDGATDLEAADAADVFVAYAGVIERPAVTAEADVVVRSASLAPILPLALGGQAPRRVFNRPLFERGLELLEPEYRSYLPYARNPE